MSETTPGVLRDLLVRRFDEIKLRLARRLGSSDLADEALQDTWLRLSRAEAVSPVHNPLAYLMRIALNLAHDRRAADRRHLTGGEVQALLELADEAPGPGEVAETRSDLRQVERFIAELPRRQRDILVSARLDELPRQEIADRLGISLSLVEKELRLALQSCMERMRRSQK